MEMKTWHRAALAAAMVLWACGEGSTGPSAVASVDITPPAPTLSAGQTMTLVAVARDAQGRALTDRTITWGSGDAAFATVSTSGAVTGVAAGSVEITATADGVEGSANVTVLPGAVESVAVEPAQVSLLPGESVQLSATLRDAQNNVLSGVPLAWVSNDASVVTVDANGLATSVAPGSATVYAVAGGRSAGSAIGVVDPDAPRVLSVQPAELLEGAAATLEGVNFSSVAAENVVTIDGIRATVTGASETALEIVVPPLACRPRHLADVRVSVAARSGQAAFPVRPAASLQLSPGELTLLRDPTAYCLQFDASAADEEYLIGVQSTASTPSTLAYAQVAGEKDATAPASAVLAIGTAPAPVALQESDPLASRVVEWRAREAEVMHREVEQARLLPREGPAAAPGAYAPALPGDVTVGTSVTLRYPNLDLTNTCQNYVEIQGTVRYVGPTGIWVSDDDNPAGGYEDVDYEGLGDEFEQDIYPTVTDYFGLPADEDGNGRIVVVVTKEVNADGIGGIVPSANLFPQAQCAGSNEGEYFFMIAPDPFGEYDVPISTDFARDISSSILGHELVHNVHLSRRYLAYGPSRLWDSWMHEGQATLGEEIMGHALTSGRGPGQNYGWTVIRNEPPIATRRWYYDSFSQLFRYYGWSGDGNPTIPTDEGSEKRPNAPEGCTFLDTPIGTNAGLCADRNLLVYGVSWSFLRWLTDQYATSLFGSEAAMHQAWIDGPASGFPSIEALVGEGIETLLAHWAASLYLDDRPPVVGSLDPLLTLPSWDLFDIESNVAPEARLLPRVRAFDDFSQNVQVRAGSTAYFLVSGANRPSTAIRMRAATGGFLNPDVQVWVVRVR